MPQLFSVGQHAALKAGQERLPDEKLLAFLDDIYIVWKPDRVGRAIEVVQTELWGRCRIRVHGGKTRIWNTAGIRPRVCDVLERIAQVDDPTARVWRGSGVPPREQFLERLWATRSSWRRICRKPLENIKRCSTPFPPFQTCTQHGSCSCVAGQPGPTTSCEWSDGGGLSILPIPMIQDCDNVSATFWASTMTSARRQSEHPPPYLYPWVGWV